MPKGKTLAIQGVEVKVFTKNHSDFISLTDIARYRDVKRADQIIQNWMRSRSTIEFLGLWEKINNIDFKPLEFEGFKNSAGENSFVMTPSRWTSATNAIGIITKPGRYNGGTFAHKDIAFEFATWISPEFKLYLIKEFQRLKEKEEEAPNQLDTWKVSRILAKLNYRIHTAAIQNHMLPPNLSQLSKILIYASEADVLNVALFGISAKEWRDANPNTQGNLRDFASIEQLVVLSNLESLNAEYIKNGISQRERLLKLNQIAREQIFQLLGNGNLDALKKI